MATHVHVGSRVCDDDHKTPFPDGPTTRVNLGELCEHHHQLKHSGEWTVHVRDDGTIDLTGPDGRSRHVRFPRLDDGPIHYEPPPEAEPMPEAEPAVPQEEPPPPF